MARLFYMGNKSKSILKNIKTIISSYRLNKIDTPLLFFLANKKKVLHKNHLTLNDGKQYKFSFYFFARLS